MVLAYNGCSSCVNFALLSFVPGGLEMTCLPSDGCSDAEEVSSTSSNPQHPFARRLVTIMLGLFDIIIAGAIIDTYNLGVIDLHDLLPRPGATHGACCSHGSPACMAYGRVLGAVR